MDENEQAQTGGEGLAGEETVADVEEGTVDEAVADTADVTDEPETAAPDPTGLHGSVPPADAPPE